MPIRYASFLIPLAVVLMQKTTPFIFFLFVDSSLWEVPPKVVYFLVTLLRYVDAALDMLTG